MLHAIDTTGMIAWHCHNPACTYHNCQGWDRGVHCAHHGEAQRTQENGQTITAHISDPEVQWTSPQDIALPPCPGCGSRMTLHVHDDEELTAPIITTDEQTGKILQVAPHPHPKFSGNLWFVDADMIKKQQPHPTLAHLSPDQIAQMQTDIKSKAPDAPTDWMLTETVQQEIHAVYQHPAVARHQQLATLLTEAGKVYTPPEPATQDFVEETVMRLLQEHGVITSPRVPALLNDEKSKDTP